uniref:Uncharacterized protein n=1 Tax=Timema shepardi TaxID=629360 RepID=A0A7R9AYW0_TIMSH|nr:unnamed protein product [Timema shepardi]
MGRRDPQVDTPEKGVNKYKEDVAILLCDSDSLICGSWVRCRLHRIWYCVCWTKLGETKEHCFHVLADYPTYNVNDNIEPCTNYTVKVSAINTNYHLYSHNVSLSFRTSMYLHSDYVYVVKRVSNNATPSIVDKEPFIMVSG